jgi:hypothetical protein
LARSVGWALKDGNLRLREQQDSKARAERACGAGRASSPPDWHPAYHLAAAPAEEHALSRSITSGTFGALTGFTVSFLAWTGLAFFGLEPPRFGFYIFSVAGAALGGWAGSHGGSVARWCGGLTLIVGLLGFAAGFFGPRLMQQDSLQGPILFGIFVSGPHGAIIGAGIGAVIGGIREWSASGHG